MASTTIIYNPDVERVSILKEESIIVGFQLTDELISDILLNIPASTFILITDTNIASLYLDDFKNRFLLHESFDTSPDHTSKRLLEYVVTPGETSKSRPVKETIEDFMLQHNCTGDSCILALGGGVIGDLAGFVAATFMRGIPFVQIPTSLLAMVDSALGGKTAVDTPAGKNLIGSFWQPKRIYIDLNYLKTLPEREFKNGMAEVIKTAAIWDEEAFDLLESGPERIRAAVMNQDAQGARVEDRTPDQQLLLQVILSSVRVKAHVVTVDERESGLRGLLNFGHSVGHAIEAILSPRLLHGECVAIGMAREAELARLLGHLDQSAVGRLVRCLQAYGLPTELTSPIVKQYAKHAHAECSAEAVLDRMKIDKKNIGDTKRVVLLERIGKTVEQKASSVQDEDLRKVLSTSVRVLPYTHTATEEMVVDVPGSKSVSNRVLLLAALGHGECRIKGLLHSDDTQVMLAALKNLHACDYYYEDSGKTLVVQGGGGKDLVIPNMPVYLGNAGTAARFLTTFATMVLPSDSPNKLILTGNARMKQRPIASLVDALRSNGQHIDYLESEGCLPLEFHPQPAGLVGGKIQLSASISSQYVSSLLLCAPYAENDVVLELIGDKVISQQYIDMTLAMMDSFGAKVYKLSNNMYRICKGVYNNPSEYIVESDASSATYPLALAAITGTTVTVPTIGSSSLQGDAAFAVKVLEPMGCTVTQTQMRTTVTGPPRGALKAIPSIDMESMTDAFLTASVLAAVASSNGGITKIYGIANQRVKECDRIHAMYTELARFGVKSEEHSDGINIHGLDIWKLDSPSEGVDCYDDHRVAMSFSVLACVAPDGAVIKERKCVEKTWPHWWDILERQLHGNIQGVDDVDDNAESDTAPVHEHIRSFKHNASIFLIGMRGVGKTTLGRLAAHYLNMKFVDMDQYFEEHHAMTIPNFVAWLGWEEFRSSETQLLGKVMKDHEEGHVIACGGGIVETEAARTLLMQYNGPVIHLKREMMEIEQYLNQDTDRPVWGQDLWEVWSRRSPWYDECSSFEFYSLDQQEGWWRAWEGFLHFVSSSYTPLKEEGAFFLSLTFPQYDTISLSLLERVTEGVDAVELRVDLLEQYDNIEWIGRQLSLLRRLTNLPVIFTVRTSEQGGKYPAANEEIYFKLVQQALRWACEYIDIEVGRNVDEIKQLMRKVNTRIIASWHDPQGLVKWNTREMQEKYKEAESFGDVVKLVSYSNDWDDNLLLKQFINKHQKKPLIAINMGEYGRLSRALNTTLTPVTHDQLPSAAAPGQLTCAEINTCRHLIGMLPKRLFYLFGQPIQHSVSPTLHNTGFKVLGLPHQYMLAESVTVEPLAEFISNAAFGGASVTIPHKETIIPMLDELTPAAQAIGAVNTIIPYEKDGKRILLGDNTDWLGIAGCAKRYHHTPSTVLVIGAGGTARAALYAVHQVGAKQIYLWNRTEERAQQLAEFFPFPIQVLSNMIDPIQIPDVIISTIPGSAVIDISETYFAKNTTLIELVYRPKMTWLVEQALEHHCNVVFGIHVLLEQGYHQFERWTGRHAPKTAIQQAVFEAYGGL